jgi:hypothetical protein
MINLLKKFNYILLDLYFQRLSILLSPIYTRYLIPEDHRILNFMNLVGWARETKWDDEQRFQYLSRRYQTSEYWTLDADRLISFKGTGFDRYHV